ncbi:MAG TPA: hypothetical protein ENI09_00250 [candidate division WWE3 bacterium]|uniref:HTH arsR-type domain-containing protein n=1 Tax=candidate division WWE3 bacterium TaxID=2053526 RepID=A0A7C1NQ03_UNCKA|nr:hypothetical protein [candidate division WWE3 bacterium]
MPLVKPGKTIKGTKGSAFGSTSKVDTLKKLFVSQVRVDILKLFLFNAGEKYHVRGITRRVGAEINAVRRELDNLVDVKLLERSPYKNRLIYSMRRDFPHLNEILGMLVKEDGLGRIFVHGRGMGDVKFAFLSIPFLLGRVAEPEDIDLLIIGRVPVRKIGDLVKAEEKRRKQEINYAVLSESEFSELKKRRDPLVLGALLQPKVILTPGAEEYLTL